MSSAKKRLNDLPLVFAMGTDTLRAEFVARLGNAAVELDTLPGSFVTARLKSEGESLIDLNALAEV